MATMFDAGTATAPSTRRRCDPTGPRSVPDDRDEALRQVYERHYDRLVGFFVNRTHDKPLAEDLAHDTILRFAGALDRFDPSRPVWPYLRTTANNVLIDHHRTDQRQVVVDAQEQFADEPTPGSELDDTIVLRSLLDRAVGDLSERQRVAVELRCERGWSAIDAAEFLGIRPGTFNQLLYRARQNLRAALEESGARLGGLVAPVLVALRLRTRSAAERVRDFVQPNTSLGVEALAGVTVAATIGVTAAVGISTAEATPEQPSRQVIELVREDVAPSTSAAVETQDQEVAVGARYTAEPAPEPDVSAEDMPPPSTRQATVIETPDAVPNSGGNVAVADDEEEFVVTSEIEARLGEREDGRGGEEVAVSCGSLAGEVLCGDDV